MLSWQAKRAFYLVAGPLMRANGFIYRHLRAPRGGRIVVQLGPGITNYFEGWTNVDANMFTARCDIWADLRNPLPFRDATVDAFYSHHVVEHLPDLVAHFAEVFRCLKPGGTYRVGGPNGDSAIDRFVANDSVWFHDWPDKRASMGGRLENFIFCRGEHLTILTSSWLRELMSAAGFTEIHVQAPTRGTSYPEVYDTPVLAREWETDFDHPHTLIVEARRPAGQN